MATFLFVSGGWHGGWSWRRVADRLRAQGHDVYTPTLTGLGERAHLYRDDVDLETHIADVMGVIEFEDLDDVILVGHSYGGMVITAIADRAPERLSRVVYLDALWPDDGESVADVVGETATQAVVAAHVDPAHPPLMAGGLEVAHMLGVTDPDDAAWVASKLTPQPPATLTQRLRLERAETGVPVLFIACLGTEMEGPQRSQQRAESRAATDPTVRVATLADAPHNAMVTHPDEITKLLTE